MATPGGAFQLGQIVHKIDGELARVNRDVGHRIGRVGNEEVLSELRKIFGSDLRLSGSRRSRKARRPATSRYKVARGGETVSIYPGGDPVYINLIKGRGGGRRFRARRRGRGKALRLPNGAIRTWSRIGEIDPQPQRLEPAARRVADRAGEEVSKAVSAALGRALR